ncbi:hypothetical protein V2J09_005061 [Rumex salicifolius]
MKKVSDYLLLKTSLICVLLSLAESASQSALVRNLPGFAGSFPSKHYSGYVKLDGGKNLFYYFVQSERSPANDPVVLWLNGGPGCSSFDGFIYEHGPFNFEAAKTSGGMPMLHLNPHSWSKVSNVIYLDSPAGVGYSYSTNGSDYVTGDQQTAIDTHAFLLKWFEMYNEFQPNPFYISGESYAGIYVPTISNEVVKGIDAGLKPFINFKGYMVGNGCTDDKYDGNALVPFVHGMGLISDALYKEVKKACGGNYYDSSDSSCKALIAKNVDGLNIYDILEPCYHSPDSSAFSQSSINLPPSFKDLGKTQKPFPIRKRMFGRAWPYRAPVKDGIVPTWPELSALSGVSCVDDRIANSWLNNAEVRKAIHASEEKVGGIWELCTSKISYYHDLGSMIQYHKNLTSRGYRALIYSGDHDMCVPYTGSQAWTSSMGYKIIDEWRPWTSNDQVAGYTQSYQKNLTFLTVKGSGHTVPEYKPQEALDFYSRWLAGKPI